MGTGEQEPELGLVRTRTPPSNQAFQMFLRLLAFCQTDPGLTCPQPPAVTVNIPQHRPSDSPCHLRNEV